MPRGDLAAGTGSTGPTPPLGDAEPKQRPLERRLGARKVDSTVADSGLAEPLFGALTGAFGALGVDLLCMFGGVGEDGHVVGAHLQETATDGEVLVSGGPPEDHLTEIEGGHERRVAGKDGELTLGAGHDEGLHVLFDADHAFGRDDLDRQGHRLSLVELAGALDGIIDRALHVEGLFRQTIVLTVENLLEPTDSFTD